MRKEAESQLNKVGICIYDELKDIGTEKAWLKIQKIDASACIHRLLALEGAIRGVKKIVLQQERKAELMEHDEVYFKKGGIVHL